MNPAKLIELQQQVRVNQAEMHDSFKDLDNWISEIKKKEKCLKTQADPSDQKLPPVRNSLQKKKKKKKVKQHQEGEDATKKPRRIRSYDFKAWDKFDVDKACKEIEEQQSEESEYETDEEWEEIRKKQQAVLLKDQGNQFLKEGRLEEAVECYTQGIQYDPDNFLLSANRAMAYLKLERYEEAELDCTAAIALDPNYVKSYQRRAKARTALTKYKEAAADWHKVISLDPKNKLAKSELEKLDKLMNPPKFSISADGDVGIVRPIHKPPEQRSKKPLRRLTIETVGNVMVTKPAEAPSPSATKQKIMSKDYQEFERFICDEKNDDITMPNGDSQLDSDNSCAVKSPKSPAEIGVTPRNQQKCLSNSTHPEDDAHSKKVKADKCTETVLSQQPQTPPMPSTCYHFQADWKILQNTTKPFYEYLRQIEPSLLPKLIGQFLDASILMKILHTLKDFYIVDNLDFIPVLQHLAEVKRFGMIVMFLSPEDKKVIRDLLAHAESKCDSDVLERLKKLYEI